MLLTQDFHIIASVATLMYHGTHPKNKNIILSQGLIPNPKERKWKDDPHAGFHQPSRKSLPGIYLTRNLMSATSAGSVPGGRGWCLLVVVSIQTGNLLADEDDLKFQLNKISLPGRVLNEWSVMHLYANYIALQKGLMKRDRDKQEAQQEIQAYKDKFIDDFISGVGYRIHLTKQEMSIVRDVLDEWGFFIALKRIAAHVHDTGYRGWGSEELWGVEKPDAGEAEADFKKLEDRLTRILKRLGRHEHREENPFNVSARIETPIGYSGKNRIVAVIEELPWESGIGTRVKVLYPPSGEVPGKLIEDWEKSHGPWEQV
jgi:hypothetical protein